jgi:multiple sugar transport system substrate-binding protein
LATARGPGQRPDGTRDGFGARVRGRGRGRSIPAEDLATRASAWLITALCLACAPGAPPGPPLLTWYVNPDNGGQARLAARCEAEAEGLFRLRVLTLPRDATQQREQLVRRLAARDASIDLMSLDLPFVPELAEAGFLLPFEERDAAALSDGVLAAPLASARWRGRLVAAPFVANAQLLWYRRSVARRAGLDLAAGPVTWDALVAAAERTGTTLEVQAKRYEGYLVWINALVASAGGALLLDPEAGRDARPGIAGPAGVRAAEVIRRLATSPAASPALSTADEEATRAAFHGPRGGFMVNWSYVYGAAREAVAAGTLDPAAVDDLGWARYPRALAGAPSRPPLGGIALAAGAFGRHPDLAVRAIRCLTSERSQARYMVDAKNPAARAAVYDDPEVRRVFPMADLVRESIRDAAPRPHTPYHADVAAAVVREFHPPAAVDPARTPAAAARLVVDVLHDRVLL